MQKWIRPAGMLLVDAVLINFSYLLAFLLRFDFSLSSHSAAQLFGFYGKWWVLLTAVKLVVFGVMGLYSSLWRFVDSGEYTRMFGGILLGNLATAVLLWILGGKFPPGLIVLIIVTDMLLVTASRGIAFYLAHRRTAQASEREAQTEGRRTMIVGADFTARDLIREMRMRRGNTLYDPVVVVAGEKDTPGTRLEGLKVTGGRKEITKLVRRNKVQDIFITIPQTQRVELAAVRKECERTSCRIWELPGLYELLDGRAQVQRHHMSLEEAEEFLGQKPISVNRRQLFTCFQGRIVLITGAASSLGRELCRQTAVFSPKTIVAVDTSERELRDLREQLKAEYPELPVRTALCSVSDEARVEEVFRKYKPHIVLHDGFCRSLETEREDLRELISRNVFGTANVIRACELCSAERLIMISSDRADDRSRPIGASLRAAEILMQRHDRSSKVLYASVRMGDTVYDADSGVEELIRQVEADGPVELSGETQSRVFSSLRESVRLALQAAAMSQGGEIFAMRTGQTVRMKELAEWVIHQYGLLPEEQIGFRYTGAALGERRPTPAAADMARETGHPQLMILEEPLTVDSPELVDFDAFREILDRESEEDVRLALQDLAQ